VIHLNRTTFALHPALPRALAVATVCFAGAAGCKHTIAVEPIEVRPIHLTLDVNLKVDRELDEFFDYEDESASTLPATMPAGESEDPVTTPAGEQAPGTTVEGGAR
jgi:hypothetical protein